MKKITLTIIAIATLTLNACNKVLDIVPKDSTAPESYYNNEAELQIALSGVYSTFIKSGTFLNNLCRMGLDADEAYNWREQNHVGDYFTSPGDTKVLNFWREYYAGIERANKLLANVNKNTSIPQAKRDIVRGEALFLRAYFYFQLVSNFGGVPLILKSIETSNANELQIPRTPAKQVYEQIISDMTASADLVQDINVIGHGGRVNKSAVYGMLTRVCLYMAGNPINDRTQYTAAKSWAEKVMANPIHKLNDSYQQVFVNYANDKYDIGESLFEVEFFGNGSGLYANLGGFIGMANGIQCTDANVGYAYAYSFCTAYAYESFGNGDLRRDWAIAPFSYTTTTTGGNTVTTKNIWATNRLFNRNVGKFRRESETSTSKTINRSNQNFPLMRFADVLLMYAEAENELNKENNGEIPSISAYEAINKVRRRGYDFDPNTPNATSDLSGLTYQTFKEQIQHERTRELAFENMRKHDLVRWGIFVPKMKSTLADAKLATSFTGLLRALAAYENASERDVLWPIPSYEIGVNPKLTQNTGY